MHSKIWLQEHFRDQYARNAQKRELRSRSWFKLAEINQVDVLLRTGMKVVDLGSFPGGWSLYAKNKVGSTGKIIACDILPMRDINGVHFFHGDCTDINFFKNLFVWTKNKKVQVVLSDMSPNITGIAIVDINKSIYLGNLALNVCRNVLMSGGNFLVKVFQGEGFDKYLLFLRCMFRTVRIYKPVSSRNRSREVYVVAKEYSNFNVKNNKLC